MKNLCFLLLQLVVWFDSNCQTFLFKDNFKYEDVALSYYAKRTIPWNKYREEIDIYKIPSQNEVDTIKYARYNNYGQLEYVEENNLVGFNHYEGKIVYPNPASLYSAENFDTELSVFHIFYDMEDMVNLTDSVLSHYNKNEQRKVSKFKRNNLGTYNIETKIEFINERKSLLISYFDMNDDGRLLFIRKFDYNPDGYFHFVPPQLSEMPSP